MNIGVLGGTFDPIHNAHLTVADEVRDRLHLAEILFVPAGQPWLKEGQEITPASHRLEMVRLAIAGKPHYKLSTIEIDRKGPTYTVDTIAELRKQSSPDTEWYFIMGWDNLAQLPRWKEPERLIKLCRLVAVPRPGYPLPDIKALEDPISGLSRSLVLLDKPEVDISSTGIRSQIEQGLPIGQLVPRPVDRYIIGHKLYLLKNQKPPVS